MATVLISERARKQLKPLPASVKLKVLKAVEMLEGWPKVRQVVKLRGRESFRVRAGDYRIFFTVEETKPATVTIAEIKPRSSAYDP